MTSAMTSAGNRVARGAHEACGSNLPNLRAVREGAWTVWWSWFFSQDADWRKSILMVLVVTRLELPWWRVKRVELFTETLTGMWRHVDGQMWMFLVAMCKAIENLHGDISYVLIGGQRWQIRWWQWFWQRRRSFWRWRFNPEDLWRRWSYRERAVKGFIDHRSWGNGKYQQNKTARHKKIRAMALIPY